MRHFLALPGVKMKLALNDRVMYVGPNGLYACVEENNTGYVIDDYGDGVYGIEFCDAEGSATAQSIMPEFFLQPT